MGERRIFLSIEGWFVHRYKENGHPKMKRNCCFQGRFKAPHWMTAHQIGGTAKGGDKMHSFMRAVTILLVAIALFAVGCSDDDGLSNPQNRPPSVTSLTAVPDSVRSGGLSVLTCIADDPDNNVLKYFWGTESDSIVGSGNSVVWFAPDTIRSRWVKCVVDDYSGGQAIDSVKILVLTQLLSYVTFTGRTIRGFDYGNNQLWEYTANSEIRRALVQDINRDGLNEAVFGTDRDGSDEAVVYALGNGGDYMWSYKTGASHWHPDDEMRVAALRAADIDNDDVVEIVVKSEHHIYFPERICAINAETGVLEGSYWHPGRSSVEATLQVADLDNDGIMEIVVGGGNNNAGNVAVVYCLKGNSIETTNWYTNLGRPVPGTYPYVSFVEILDDLTSDGIRDVKCGWGSQSLPSHTMYVNGATGATFTPQEQRYVGR
jgi:hypothetical protein